MSELVTTAAVELANYYQFPVAIIPSRRQVDAEQFGGGYVENWTTSAFARFVRSIDMGGYALLSRDHSGPWQGSSSPDPLPGEMELVDAMTEVKKSLSDDIQNGFDLLHIDPSLALQRGFSEDDVEEMAIELVAHCVKESSSVGGSIAFEVGTDEQDIAPEPIALSRTRLRKLLTKLDHYGLPRPIFYVVQTGTKVMEMRNIGSFDQLDGAKGSMPPSAYVPSTLNMCLAEGVLLKEHNADYLSDKALIWHRKFGIHAANVAPQFGVVETCALLDAFNILGMNKEYEEFSQIVLDGERWKKWMLPNSKSPDADKVKIAGHYHFSDPAVREMRKKAALKGAGRGFDTESSIKGEIKNSISRYMIAFGYGT